MRSGERLDLIFLNENDSSECNVVPPLENDAGCQSDHGILEGHNSMKHCHNFTWINYQTRDQQKENFKRFGRLYCAVDWEAVIGNTTCPSEMTERLHSTTMSIINRCLPWQERRIRSTDDPWITDEIRRAIRKWKRRFRKYQRSSKWQQVKEETEALIKKSKSEYYQKSVDKLKDQGAGVIPYKILNNVAIPDRPNPGR